VTVARCLDQLAALLRLFPQRHELLHALIRRPAALRRGRTFERRSGDRRGRRRPGNELEDAPMPALGAPPLTGGNGEAALLDELIRQRRGE